MTDSDKQDSRLFQLASLEDEWPFMAHSSRKGPVEPKAALPPIPAVRDLRAELRLVSGVELPSLVEAPEGKF